MASNGFMGNVVGEHELFRAYFALLSMDKIANQTILSPCFGIIGYPSLTDVALGRAGPAVDINQCYLSTSPPYRTGAYTVYRIDEVTVLVYGGGSVGFSSLQCGVISDGVGVTQPYGTLPGQATNLGNSWLRLHLPEQAVVNSGALDPCAALGANAQYNVPTLYLGTVRLPSSKEFPNDEQTEHAAVLMEWYPLDDERGQAVCLDAMHHQVRHRYGLPTTDALGTNMTATAPQQTILRGRWLI